MVAECPMETAHVVIPSDRMAVRQALRALFDHLIPGPICPEAREAAQIVLAEALNNIVEHAYAHSPGEIEVTICFSHQGLTCQITDAGLPMPGNRPPDGQLPVAPPGSDLPEGGYGWHLIRTLSQDLSYQREGGRNRLTFRIAAQQFRH